MRKYNKSKDNNLGRFLKLNYIYFHEKKALTLCFGNAIYIRTYEFHYYSDMHYTKFILMICLGIVRLKKMCLYII